MIIGIDIRNIGKKRTGDEVVFFSLAKNLALIDTDNEYRLFTDAADKEAIFKIKTALGIEDRPNFRIIPLVAIKPLQNKFGWNVWTLPRYLRRNPVDIYLTQYITPFFVSKKVKMLTIIHDISFNFFPQFIKFFDLLFLKILIPLSLKRADKIIGVSKFTQDEIIKFYKVDPQKVSYVYNAVADSFLSEKFSEQKLEAVREKYNLPKKFILYLGTLQPRKNLPTLIDAFGQIKNNIPGVSLVLAGSRRARNFDKKIDTATEKNSVKNDVLFPGFIDEDDKKSVFGLASVFCFPSLYEGFGIPALEAMASGVPVVASNIAPLREISAGAAALFDPKNSQNLAENLRMIFTNESLREKLKVRGSVQVQKFSWKNSAAKLLEIFNSYKKD